MGSIYPESLGGSGGDVFHLIAQTEALMAGGSTGVVMGLGSLSIALPPILHLGNDEQKTRFITPVLKGEKIAALAVTEPGTGSDVAGIRTTARRDGDDYVINGSKLFITSGARADFVSVLCRTGEDPHGGLTFLVVERGMPGFSVSKSLKKMGWRASDTAELAFDNVRVPVENRIGPEGSGFLAVMNNFQNERLSLAVVGHATAELALAESERYVREREAFGRKVIGFQVTRHTLARMSTLVRASKSLNYQVADAMRRGQTVVEEVSQAKNFASEVAGQVCDEAVQLHGGMGYMRETVVERLFRDARLLPIGGGTREIMNEVIARVRGYRA
ncbi:MAG: acyl-CoA dehydrogenase family protein [Myxococcales bacterium]|nr:acyl-CoA dehydrogenase family protein [Myxococcales bacterium]